MTVAGMRSEIAELAAEFGLREEFPREALEQADALPAEAAAKPGEQREDLRDLPLVTIDGSDAKDFDDAVHCRELDGGWELIVAIADVSAHVPAGTPMDKEARKRATSSYFPGCVLPMLPPRVSEGLCSLKPDADRLCLLCRMRFDAQGKLLGSTFAAGIMRSRRRLTYGQAAGIVEGKPDGATDESLHALAALTKKLEHARLAAGALKLTLPTPQLRIEGGRCVGVDEYVPLRSHSIIEECMLAANVCAARFLQEKNQPLLFRVHAEPEKERIEQLRLLLREYGIQVGELKDAHEMQKVIDAVMQLPPLRAHALTFNVLRTLSRAVYTPRNAGHYGLGFADYTHFTSPIRRYPDLLVHRRIRAALAGEQPPADMAASLTEIGEHCSAAEQNSEKAERRLVGRMIARLQSDAVGVQQDGVITGIARFGVFVMFGGFAEGLLPLSELRDDYYQLEDSDTVLVGRKTKRMLRVGMPLAVAVSNVDMREGRCRLRLA